jgi:hypothetical protein
MKVRNAVTAYPFAVPRNERVFGWDAGLFEVDAC